MFMREVVIQLRVAVPRRVSLAAKRVEQSATRPGTSGSGTATLWAHTGVGVGVTVGVLVAVGVEVAVGVAVGVLVAVGVEVDVGVAVEQAGRERLRISILRLGRSSKACGISPHN